MGAGRCILLIEPRADNRFHSVADRPSFDLAPLIRIPPSSTCAPAPRQTAPPVRQRHFSRVMATPQDRQNDHGSWPAHRRPPRLQRQRPVSAVLASTPADVRMEERDGDETLHYLGMRTATPLAKGWYPAFDVRIIAHSNAVRSYSFRGLLSFLQEVGRADKLDLVALKPPAAWQSRAWGARDL